MGLLAMGSRAFGFSSGFAVKVGNEDPGPQSMMACSPGEAELVAWGIATVTVLGSDGAVVLRTLILCRILDDEWMGFTGFGTAERSRCSSVVVV